MTTTAERLESVRKRITIVRGILEDASTLSEITVDGVGEKFDRAALRAELRELEAEEDRLTAAAEGRSPRLFRVRIQR